MTVRNLGCLRDQNWLNSEVMNFYIGLIMERDKESCAIDSVRKPCYAFTTFLMAFLMPNSREEPIRFANVKK